MVRFENIIKTIVGTIIICAVVSACDSFGIDKESPSYGKYGYILALQNAVASRSDSPTVFSTGDSLYFYFDGEIKTEAVAIFGEDSQWHISLNKELKPGDSGRCNVVYAVGGELIPTEYDYYRINSGTALYGTRDARWAYSNGTISVLAQLYPLQVKLKFISDRETEIMIKGIQPEDNFSVKQFSHWTYKDKYRPCYPQSIKIDKEDADGNYVSDDYYCIGIGTDGYCNSKYNTDNVGCYHEDSSNGDDGKVPCFLDKVYIFDRSNIQNCYSRAFPTAISTGSTLIIKIPTPISHEGWQIMDNEIQAIIGDRQGVYIMTGINNTCGYSVNFSVRKNFGTYDALNVHVGNINIFYMIKPNDDWENFSAVSSSNYNDAEIVFVGKSGDANVSPFNYFKDITYSHFPFYKNELVESWSDY